MQILKYVYYIYIFLGVLFIYDGFERINKNQEHPWLSFLIGVGAIGMFLFRKKYNKKFEDHYNKK